MSRIRKPLKRIALTGFMGVGKSTVARHLARLVGARWMDVDLMIEKRIGEKVAQFVDREGIDSFRKVEQEILSGVVPDTSYPILSLGGGSFVNEANRALIKENNVTTIWLEATFEHCWANISMSYKDRPLARNRADAKRLFEERRKIYCLADWHFIVLPGCNSFAVAEQIAEQVYGLD